MPAKLIFFAYLPNIFCIALRKNKHYAVNKY
jgi:hypothetical protein